MSEIPCFEGCRAANLEIVDDFHYVQDHVNGRSNN
jgi:hypothetical protein